MGISRFRHHPLLFVRPHSREVCLGRPTSFETWFERHGIEQLDYSSKYIYLGLLN